MALWSRASQTHAARTRRRVLQEMPGGHVWRDHSPNHTGIRWDEVLIAGQYRGIMFQGDEPEYPPAQVEILSDHHLRATLRCRDGDMLAFTLLTDQGTGKRP